MVDSFGSALRQLRQDRGWSLQQLAAKVLSSKSGVGMYETGERRPTVEFAAACDHVFGTTPILTTLCGLDGEDDDMRRRALLTSFTAAAGVGALTSYAALADVIRLDLQEAAGIDEDWDSTVADFKRRLATEPSAAFGDELLAKMIVARQQITELGSPDALRASAHLGLLYGLWMGNNGNMVVGHSYLKTANLLAFRSGHTDTRTYVLARAAVGGPYQGLSAELTKRNLGAALALAGDRATDGALEAQAAQVQIAALTGDLATGRDGIRRMWAIAERMPPTTAAEPGPALRTVSFHAYLEGRLGSLYDAEKANLQAEMILRPVPLWLAEARLYFALAMVRHGAIEQGLRFALDAANQMRYSVRVIRLAVNDVLAALPPGYRSDLVDELRVHATTGPKPWELILT